MQIATSTEMWYLTPVELPQAKPFSFLLSTDGRSHWNTLNCSFYRLIILKDVFLKNFSFYYEDIWIWSLETEI